MEAYLKFLEEYFSTPVFQKFLFSNFFASLDEFPNEPMIFGEVFRSPPIFMKNFGNLFVPFKLFLASEFFNKFWPQYFPDPNHFIAQKANLQRAQTGLSFGVFIIMKIDELIPTAFHDTFMSAICVPFVSQSQLVAAPPLPPAVYESVSYKLIKASQHDVSLTIYIERDHCLVCKSSPYLETKLLYCSRCKVASYCGKDHQTLHWPEHKQHCKQLAAL